MLSFFLLVHLKEEADKSHPVLWMSSVVVLCCSYVVPRPINILLKTW